MDSFFHVMSAKPATGSGGGGSGFRMRGFPGTERARGAPGSALMPRGRVRVCLPTQVERRRGKGFREGKNTPSSSRAVRCESIQCSAVRRRFDNLSLLRSIDDMTSRSLPRLSLRRRRSARARRRREMDFPTSQGGTR